MDGRRCVPKNSAEMFGKLILNVSKVTLNYLQDTKKVKLNLKHPDRPNVRKFVLQLRNLEKTAREDDSMELTLKSGLPVENGKVVSPRDIIFSDGQRLVRFKVQSANDAPPAAKPLTEGPMLH